MARQTVLGFSRVFQRILGCVFLACALLAIGGFVAPSEAFAQEQQFTPNARVDEDGVLHWDAEGEYLSRIDLSPLMFGPDSANYCAPSVNGEYTYDIENLFQMAEQFYGGIGTGDVSGLDGEHPVTFVYYERQADGTMEEVGRAKGTYRYPYTTGLLVKLDTPSKPTWTGDGFTASWEAVDNAANYQVTFYETTASGSTSEVGETTTANTSCELTSVVTSPKDGVAYSFEVRARGPEGNFEYRASDTSAKSAPSGVWKTPVVEYGLSVGGVDVTSENATDVLDDGGTVSYDPDSRTLTLRSATIAGTGETGAAIRRVAHGGPDSLTINLDGTNSCGSIVIGGNEDDLCPLTISGKGSLTVSETATAGAISAQGDITVDGVTLTVNTGEGGIQSNLRDIIIKNAIVDLDALTSDAYYCLMANSIRIENSTVDALSEGVNSNPLLASDSLSIVGSTVTVEAKSAENPAVWASNIEISLASDVKVYGGSSNAVYSEGSITIDDSIAWVEGVSRDAYPALYAYGDISVSASMLTAKSAGMRGIFTDADMTISDSTVTASGTTEEGMVVVGALAVENSTLHASTSSDNEMKPALVTEQLRVVASEVTLEGGLDLSGWYDLSTDNAELVIEPAANELVEFKVDAQNRDGSAAAHFREEGSDSPYDARVELTEAQMNWLGAYRYIHIGEHVHEGGTATCSAGAVCDDCGREYGVVDPNAHSFTHYVSNNDATCTGDGTETADCDNGCGATDTRVMQGSALGHDSELIDAKPATCEDNGYSGDEKCVRCGEVITSGKVIPALGHDYVDGVCMVCGVEDPDYVAPEEPEKPGDQDPDQPTGPSAEEGPADEDIPAAGDASALFSLVPALAGASVLTAGVLARRRR